VRARRKRQRIQQAQARVLASSPGDVTATYVGRAVEIVLLAAPPRAAVAAFTISSREHTLAPHARGSSIELDCTLASPWAETTTTRS
jgi:hypothetical protein